MTTCPACGKEQTGTSAFCASCGVLLDRPNTTAAIAEPAVSGPPPTPAATPADDFGDVGQYVARRLFALIVDLIGVTALVATGIAYLVARSGGDPRSFGAFFETAVYTLFAMIVYLCVSEAYFGTTLGKALMGLRVRGPGTGRVGIARGVGRNVFLPFDLLVIGFLLAVVTPRRKRIGDFVAGTEVVNAQRPALWALAALAIIGVWGYAEYAYADGLRTAQTLSNSAATYGPALVGGQGAPPVVPTPLPARTAVPTEQPITVPTLAPSPASSPSASPAASPRTSPGASASPLATALPSPQASSQSAPPPAQPSAPASSPVASPAPSSTTS